MPGAGPGAVIPPGRTGNNLQADVSTFVGRVEELADISAAAEKRRLLTLVGPGGSGKSRLAAQLARRRLGHHRDGVWWVDLGGVREPAGVLRACAGTLGVLLDPGRPPIEGFLRQVRNRDLLLVLDTCEHLLATTADLVHELLSVCPHIFVLTTSREPLGLSGEAVWPVPPLTIEDARDLFADRAGLAAPHFDLPAHDGTVNGIVNRVDRLPLGVELAAARIRLLTPTEILESLSNRLQLLNERGLSRTTPRHQNLLASIAWSHDLLDEQERRLFRRLTLFAGSFDLEAVEAVAAEPPAIPEQTTGSSAPSIRADLLRLVDKSLVVRRESGQRTRFRLLDTIREYAGEQLEQAGEVDNLRDRHLRWCVTVAENADRGLAVDQDRWRELLAGQHDDILAALEWAIADPSRYPDARRLALAMTRFWFVSGTSAEGRRQLRRAVELDGSATTLEQGRLVGNLALLCTVTGRAEEAGGRADQGSAIAEAYDDDGLRATCMLVRAYLFYYTDQTRCRELALEAHGLAAAVDDVFLRDWCQVIAAYALQAEDRHTEAVGLARPAYEAAMDRGDRFVAAFARGLEGYAALQTGAVREATRIAEEQIRLAEPLQDYFAVGTLTANAALAFVRAGRTAEAAQLLSPIIESVRDRRDVDVVGLVVALGQLHLVEGRFVEAVAWFGRGLDRSRTTEIDWTAARCAAGLVSALRRSGRRDEAQRAAERGQVLVAGFAAPQLRADLLDEQAHLQLEVDPSAARNLYHRALGIRREAGIDTYLPDSLDALVEVGCRDEPTADLARILAASDGARQRLGVPRPGIDRDAYEAAVAALQAALGPERFAEAIAEGSALGLADAIELVSRGRGRRHRPAAGWASLTPTEISVVRLVVAGLSNPEIGQRLFVSRSTVKAHLAHIFTKLGVANRTELATFAMPQLEPG